jgi:lysozyme-like protein
VTNYTYGQLETLWIQGGGSQALAPLMAAIALAESGGDPNANNTKDNGGTQTSWGLWQISNGTHNMPVPNINNPLVNAQQAVAKYQSQGLGAWGTYNSGAYKKFYQSNVDPSTLPQGGSGGNVSTDASLIPSWLQDVLGFLPGGEEANIVGELADPQNWVDWLERAALMLFGGLLILIGIFKLAGGDKSVTNIVAPGQEPSDKAPATTALSTEAEEAAVAA